MNVVRCETPQAFLERAQAFLLRDEACHNLLLGTPTTLMARVITPALPPYFAVVADAGSVVAAAMMTPPISWSCREQSIRNLWACSRRTS